MNALLVLYAGNLSGEALELLIAGKNSIELALERSQQFPGIGKIVILTTPEWGTGNREQGIGKIHIDKRPSWTVKSLLEAIAEYSSGFDLTFFSWADCPFLDPDLTKRLSERHLRYAAEYSYADGWPYGLSPELLSPGTAAILAKILKDEDDGPVERDSVFSVIRKDINAFDIETEISSVDLRCHRLKLCADSKRNLLLLKRFAANGIPSSADVENIIAEKPQLLRTLPAFYPIQVYGGCPQSCSWCLWPKASELPVTERRDYMNTDQFESLLNKIIAFSGDAVIDLSLWGELSLHIQKMELIEMVLSRPELSLVIETSGIGWSYKELERCAELVKKYSVCSYKFPSALSWIVSLDTADQTRYKEIRGAGFAEANDCAKKLFSLFSKDVYVQAVRTTGAEDDIEKFYRYWKENAPSVANVIIQKYNDSCGALPKKQVSDLSPIQRKPCWHIMRDMPILLDGTVLLCREQIAAPNSSIILGNALLEPLDHIWEKGQQIYEEHTAAKYNSLCAGCDEYYTYNF